MSERYPGGSFERSFRRDREPLLETKKTLDEINAVIAKLVEQTGDLSSDSKQYLRGQVQALLGDLGLTDISQLADFTAAFHQGMNDRLRNPKIPSNYPDEGKFARDFTDVLAEPELRHLPPVLKGVVASEVARFGQSDWKTVSGRGRDVFEYHYNLGKILCDELAYTQLFEPGDELMIKDTWQVDNGRHRTLALRTLGEPFTRSVGLDNWIVVKKVTD